MHRAVARSDSYEIAYMSRTQTGLEAYLILSGAPLNQVRAMLLLLRETSIQHR